MNISLRTTSLLLVTTAIAAACGGNVVLDGQGSTGGATSTTAMTGVGAGVGTTVGVGGFSSGPATSTVTSTATSASSSSSTTTSTSSSGAMGACTQGGDPKEFYNPGLNDILTKCALQNLGNASATSNCITLQTGLSDGCVKCLNDDVTCAEQHCSNMCIPPNTSSKACVACRATNCDPAFVACSGMLAAPGSQSCAGVLGGGPAVKPGEPGLLPSAFTTVAGGTAYTNLQSCACNTVEGGNPPGCQDVCDDHLNGTNTPNYCNGTVASPKCAACLQMICTKQLAVCAAN